MGRRYRAGPGRAAPAVAPRQPPAAASARLAGLAGQGGRRHPRAAVCADVRRTPVRLPVHDGRRRARGLLRPVPHSRRLRRRSGPEGTAQAGALLAQYADGRRRAAACGRCAETPFRRPRRCPETHASLNPETEFRHMKITQKVLLASLFGVSLAAGAAVLKTDPAKTTVSAVFKQMNVPVESKFTKHRVVIDYNAAAVDSSKATVEVDTASLDLGEAEMNKEVAKKEWFNAAQYPKATFVSSSIKNAGAGKLTVAGKLTIKGKAADVTFPVTVKTEGGKQVFDGAVPIKRLAFNIGEGEWKDTGMVADEVTIKFHVVSQ